MSAQTTTFRTGDTSSDSTGAFISGLLALLVAVAAAYVLLRATGVISPGALLPSGIAAGPLFGWMRRLNEEGQLITASVSLLVGLSALWTMVVLGSGDKPRAAGGARGRGGFLQVLDTDERGTVLLSSDGIEAVARTAVESTPGVFDAEVNAVPKGRGVALSVDISVLESADVRRAGIGARDRAVEAMERFAGVDVHGVSVRVNVMPPEALGRSVL